jgi:predicted component of type VI protein secretion system
MFDLLRTLRGRLLDPETFDHAAAELRSEQAVQFAASFEKQLGERQQSGSQASTEDDTATLERLLGAGALAGIDRKTEPPADTDTLIRRIVSPRITPESSHLQLYLDAVDASVARQMRAVLSNSAFRRLESCWRSLAWLLSSVETDESLEIAPLDVSKESLRAELVDTCSDPLDSDFFRQLYETEGTRPGGQRWSLKVSDYSFDAGPSDAALLEALGTIGNAAHACRSQDGKSDMQACADAYLAERA